MSTFHGLEMAKQALFAQQSALYTTGHNISNANTDGYSRQRVNFETMNPYPAGSRNRPQIPGQMGTGVQAGSVQRIRNEFLDIQFRGENSKSGYWETKADALSRLENVMNEPSESGLSKTMDQFWQSLQDLAANPEKDSGVRSVVFQRGQAVADTFNYLSNSLNSIQGDLKSQIDTTVKDANSLIEQIHNINEQVKQVEPHGFLANDLYDERDRLIDELSKIVNIKVTDQSSGESSLDIADGLKKIDVMDSEGNVLGTLIDEEEGILNKIDVNFEVNEATGEETLTLEAGGTDIKESNGSLKGLVESYEVTYPEMLSNLDKMAYKFADAFNGIHSNFFDVEETGAAGNIKVALDSADEIVASNENNDGKIASDLADLFEKSLDGLEDKSVKGYFQSIIGELGVEAQQANRMADNTIILRSQVENQRMSVSSVSLDEEMSNMIKFQHAYNAAARSMTTIDEMIDRIINSMGLVGR
ncbi:flagellar hook-associated protein FlgK [Virgibacillus indicus]|uniref:Flagellar hook-associated protein 1 n=1 Tax=Virgibacillus indicus TaxID=2024554 RepID=A0A265N9V0_9BACI|nr:flagellar hook-associated protein FlgK [Virgibacillus indicus]OZU88800.1 flagellar hook-associated protein FlgK [Virgibacillus indicus]